MSDFLERLAHRTVLPTVRGSGAPPLEPRLPGRFEPSSPRTHEDDAADLAEEHVEVAAAATDPAPSAPRPDPPAPSPIRPAPAPPPTEHPDEVRPGSPTPEEAPTGVVPPPIAAAASADRAATEARPLDPEIAPAPTRRPATDLPASAPSTAQELAHRDRARPQPTPPATAATLEPVIEVHRVPVPVAAPAPPSERQRPHLAERSRPEPTAADAPQVAPRAVVFEPREPLAPLRLEPLAEHEVFAVPALADVATPDSVVHVHIGRLEVNRPAPTPPPAPAPRRRAPTMSLDEYLTRRTAGGVDGGYRR